MIFLFLDNQIKKKFSENEIIKLNWQIFLFADKKSDCIKSFAMSKYKTAEFVCCIHNM